MMGWFRAYNFESHFLLSSTMNIIRNQFHAAVEARDSVTAASLYRPEWVDVCDTYEELVFLWPIIIKRPQEEATRIICLNLGEADDDTQEFILRNIPQFVTDRDLAKVLKRRSPEFALCYFATERQGVMELVKDWSLCDVPEDVAETLIEIGYGSKLCPSSCDFSYAFMKEHFEAMEGQRFITESHRDGYDGPWDLLIISLCNTMPSRDAMETFAKRVSHICYNDVPDDYIEQVPLAVQRIRDHYQQLGIYLDFPEMNIRAVGAY
jgi:hypothetical protein